MKLIGKNILIVPVAEEEKTKSGLLISGTETSNMRYQKANVEAVGTDVAHIKPGNVIYFDKANSHDIRINDKPFKVILERDVVVVL